MRAPARVETGRGFTIRLSETDAEPLDRANSSLTVYEEDAATPFARVSLRRSCRRGSCTYRARVPARATAGIVGRMVTWHAVVCAEGTGNVVHTAGVLPVAAAATRP